MIRRLDHKFRFQLLAKWLEENYQPCRAADVGGSKGLLAYLLNLKGWQCTVIDPAEPDPVTKYKDLETGKRVLVTKDESKNIPRIRKRFELEMVKDFDLLIGLHAHGCNLKIIESCRKYNKKLVLLPCCVVNEPLEIKPNINWFESLAEYAKNGGLKVETDEINFKGQNKIIFVR